jgi:hypothetical protein
MRLIDSSCVGGGMVLDDGRDGTRTMVSIETRPRDGPTRSIDGTGLSGGAVGGGTGVIGGVAGDCIAMFRDGVYDRSAEDDDRAGCWSLIQELLSEDNSL